MVQILAIPSTIFLSLSAQRSIVLEHRDLMSIELIHQNNEILCYSPEFFWVRNKKFSIVANDL